MDKNSKATSKNVLHNFARNLNMKFRVFYHIDSKTNFQDVLSVQMDYHLAYQRVKSVMEKMTVKMAQMSLLVKHERM